MRKKFKAISLLLSLSIFITGLSISGCGKKQNDACPYEDFIVIDVFDTLANYQGIQSGWFAKVVKDKFNMELNIIAPNVAGGGDTLFDTRAAAGNLGDLVIYGVDDGSLSKHVSSGLLLDMTDYLKDKDIMRYDYAIRALNEVVEGNAVYAIPTEVSSNPSTLSKETLELTYGPYIRWDLYAALGYPKLSTLEDLLPLLKQMQELEPYSDSGKPTYAFSFFRDWDDNLMTAAKQPACFYGYDETGFVLLKADSNEYQNIIDENSLYIRNLKFYFDANQMGLVDPDSNIQNYDTVFEKYKDGQILYSPWPWLGQSAYNTETHVSKGKGLMLAPIEDLQIYSYGCYPEGNSKTVISIGSNTQDPQRLVDFIDWLYSPEGIAMNQAQRSAAAAGPEGLTWEMTENGPVLTDFGIDTLIHRKDLEVPKEYGTGTWEDGVSELNFVAVTLSDLSPDGFPYAYDLWDSVIAKKNTSLQEDWNSFMNAASTMEYLKSNDKLVVSTGCNYTQPPESSEISTIRSQCRSIIVDYSWRMIFAADEAEFYTLLKELQDIAYSLGYEQVLTEDIKNAEALHEARLASAIQYSKENMQKSKAN